VHFTSQVVAGLIYQVKYKVGNDYVHAKIFKPLPHTGQPAQVQIATRGHTVDA